MCTIEGLSLVYIGTFTSYNASRLIWLQLQIWSYSYKLLAPLDIWAVLAYDQEQQQRRRCFTLIFCSNWVVIYCYEITSRLLFGTY